MDRLMKIGFVLLFTIHLGIAQNDENFELSKQNLIIKEGIYVDFESLKHQHSIDKSVVITAIPLNDPQFYNLLTGKDKIYYYDDSN